MRPPLHSLIALAVIQIGLSSTPEAAPQRTELFDRLHQTESRKQYARSPSGGLDDLIARGHGELALAFYVQGVAERVAEAGRSQDPGLTHLRREEQRAEKSHSIDRGDFFYYAALLKSQIAVEHAVYRQRETLVAAWQKSLGIIGQEEAMPQAVSPKLRAAFQWAIGQSAIADQEYRDGRGGAGIRSAEELLERAHEAWAKGGASTTDKYWVALLKAQLYRLQTQNRLPEKTLRIYSQLAQTAITHLHRTDQ